MVSVCGWRLRFRLRLRSKLRFRLAGGAGAGAGVGAGMGAVVGAGAEATEYSGIPPRDLKIRLLGPNGTLVTVCL